MVHFPRMRIFVITLVTCLSLVSGTAVTVLQGNVFVDVVLSLYTNNNTQCGKIDPEVVQNLQAIVWTFEKLNAGTYLTGSTFGVRVHATCRSVDNAATVAHEIAVDLYNANGMMRTVGVIGSDYSSETEAISRLLSSLPDEFRLLQIGFAPTSASLRDKEKYNNFYRTIPPDDVQVEVMMSFMEEMDFTYLAVIYDDDAYGRGGVDALLAGVDKKNICFGLKVAVNPIDTEENILQTLTERLTELRSMDGTNGSLPSRGILVFGGMKLGKLLMTALDDVYSPSITLPVLIFSEASSYFEGEYTSVSKGAYVLSPPRRTVEEFHTHWTETLLSYNDMGSADTPNKWLKDMYETTFNCDINTTCTQRTAGEIADAFPPSIYTEYAIQAALTIAKVTKNVAEAKCGTNPVNDCDAFFATPRRDFLDEMDNLVVQFDEDFPFRIEEFKNPDLVFTFNGTEVQRPAEFPLYQVYNHQQCSGGFCFSKVADFQTDYNLQLDKAAIKDYSGNGSLLSWPNIRKAQCPDGAVCTPCITGNTDEIMFIPGDLYVVGVVPVHSVGSTPLECGQIKAGGLDIVEAIRFAIDDAKTKFIGSVPEADIGMIIIDSCNDAQVIQEKILSVHRHGVYSQGRYIPVNDKIIGYIGSWSSHVSVAIAEITTRLGFTQISYGSTAPVLSKRWLYPYFLRVPSPDGAQADIILRIAQDLGSNYIQIIYSETTYGEGGLDELLSRVDAAHICVAQVIGVTHIANPTDLVEKIKTHSKARVLVLFMSSFELTWTVKAFHDNFQRNEFVYIASEGWGTRDIVTGFNNIIGTITLSSEMPSNTQFKGYLKTLAPDVVDADPWIRDYMESEFGCYYQWSYNKSSDNACSGSERLDADNQNYKIDSWAAFTKKAVYALLKGAYTTMLSLCNTTTYVCEEFHARPDVLVANIIDVRLDDGFSILKPVFDDNGDGLAGYHINVVTLENGNNYEDIGEANPSGLFTFNKVKWEAITGMEVNSSCSNAAICPECYSEGNGERVVQGEASSSVSVGVIVVICVLALLACVFAGILLYICNRHGCCIKMEKGRPRLTNTYLSPIYLSERRPDGSDHVKPTHHFRPKSHDAENYDYIMDENISAGSAGRRGPDGGRDTNTSSGYHGSRDMIGQYPSGGSSSGSQGNDDYILEAPRGCSNQSVPSRNAARVDNQGAGSHGDSNQGISNESFNPDDESKYSLGRDSIQSKQSEKSVGYLRSVKTNL